jgi:hypothetical protein
MNDFPLAPETPLGSPAPFWFILLFKTLGFTLHMIPMHIWFAGTVLIALFSLFGSMHARLLAHRMINALPILIALGINFGIVPLLFIQVSYYPVVYPANILIGWYWFAIIPLLIIAYYGVYYYAVQVRRGKVTARGVFCGVISSLAFLAIGYIFSNNFTLMTNEAQMMAAYDRTAVGGAVTGTALNTGDPTLLPRWLMMFGLALMTTAVYILVDTVLLAKREKEEYRAWAAKFAFLLHTVGLVWFAAMGSWYLFGALSPELRQAAQSSVSVLFGLTAVAPGLVWLCMLLGRSRASDGRIALAAAAAQVVVLALNAVSRQWLQNVELARFFDPAKMRVDTQWSPMIVFLVLFVLGLGVVGWMLWQLAQALRPEPAMASSSGAHKSRQHG